MKKVYNCSQYLPRYRRKCRHPVKRYGDKCYQHAPLKYPRPERCPICDSYMYRYTLPLKPCGHWTCPNCVIRSGKDMCPFCRSKIMIPAKNKLSFSLYKEDNREYIEDVTLETLGITYDEQLLQLVYDLVNAIEV